MMTTVYEKYYGRPDVHLSMNYILRKDTGNRTALYFGEGYALPSETNMEDTVGVFCLKCGEYHEYPAETFASNTEDNLTCGCGKPFRMKDTVNTNCNAASRRSVSSIRGSFPGRLKITVHDGDRIHISAIGRNYYLNPKAMKPYSTAYQITVVINVATGQTYVMPAQYHNKKLFADSAGVRTASYAHNIALACISRVFFESDPDAMTALEAAFKSLEPGVSRHLATLEDVAHANFLKNLYDYLPHESDDNNFMTYMHRDMYRILRSRYRKDPATFPKYLYHGCSRVAKKSIRKILYTHPELKWSLRYLYKTLGITNPDILRTLLTEKVAAVDIMACAFRGSKDDLRKIKALADACRNSGMTDKDIAAFFLIEDNRHHAPGTVRDAARMYQSSPLAPEEIRAYRTIDGLHDALVELEIRRRDQRQWERYNAEVSYEEPINALEGPCDDAVFRIIRRPWELKALGKRFHNCVGSYMEDVRSNYSVIVEMTIDDKPAACIELDGDGKVCRQAFAACNQPLEGCAAASFKEWTKRHKITPGHMTPHVNHLDFYDFYDAIPF